MKVNKSIYENLDSIPVAEKEKAGKSSKWGSRFYIIKAETRGTVKFYAVSFNIFERLANAFLKFFFHFNYFARKLDANSITILDPSALNSTAKKADLFAPTASRNSASTFPSSQTATSAAAPKFDAQPSRPLAAVLPPNPKISSPTTSSSTSSPILSYEQVRVVNELPLIISSAFDKPNFTAGLTYDEQVRLQQSGWISNFSSPSEVNSSLKTAVNLIEKSYRTQRRKTKDPKITAPRELQHQLELLINLNASTKTLAEKQRSLRLLIKQVVSSGSGISTNLDNSERRTLQRIEASQDYSLENAIGTIELIEKLHTARDGTLLEISNNEAQAAFDEFELTAGFFTVSP